ncbi:MAG: endonuclease/exonuclease/phosphatase family protein [Muribaculaceae bacterium]|nr:endonuclease/exonuclease/phosphatase family protein [Muribaculaceae bacterium]
MKKILLFAVAVFTVSLLGLAQEKQYQVYGVAFYNLENLFDTINNNGKYDLEFSPAGQRQWNGDKYRSKLKNMAYAISQMKTKVTPNGPAIIGVSEIENKSVLDDLVKEESIKNLHLQVVHHDSPDRRGVDVGLLYNPRLFRVLSVSNTTLNIEGNPGFRTRDQMCVTGILGGEKVSVIVNHWPSRLGGQEQSSYLREAAAALSKHIADSVRSVDPNQGIIIMGDLNDDPMDKSCAVVINAKKDKDEALKSGFYNPWWAMLDKGIGTLAYRGQWNLFDQIIISDYFLGKDRKKLTYFKNEVLNKEFLKTKEGDRQGYPLRTYSAGVFLNGYSDHFPTQIFLVKEAPTR